MTDVDPQALPSARGAVPAPRGPEPSARPSVWTSPASPPATSAATPQAANVAASRAHAAGSRRKPRAAESPALPQLGTGRVVGGAVLLTAAVVAFDVWLTGRLSLFFDLCFVLVSLSAALLTRRRGLFAVAVLGPLLLGGVVALLGATAPRALTTSDLPFVSTWLTGLAHHGAALAAAQSVALAVVGLRAAQTSGVSGPDEKVD